MNILTDGLIEVLDRNPLAFGGAGYMKIRFSDQLMMPEWPFGRFAPCVGPVSHRATLHENNGMVAVLARDGSRQSEDEMRLAPPRHHFETDSGQMVAFVNNYLAVVADKIIDVNLADEALDERNVDNAGWTPFSAADRSDTCPGSIEETREALDPLVHQ